MNPTRPLDAFAEQLRAEFESRLEQVKEAKRLITDLRGILEATPAIRSVLAEELGLLAGTVQSENKSSQSKNPRSPDREAEAEELEEAEETDAQEDEEEAATDTSGTLTERIIDFFVTRNNHHANILTIANSVSGKQLSVRGILYKKARNKGRFVRAGPNGTELGKRWELSSMELKRLAAEGRIRIEPADSPVTSPMSGQRAQDL